MDNITEMLNKIRNAGAVKKPDVFIPFSNLKHEICKIFQKEGFVSEVKTANKGKLKTIKIILKYDNGLFAIEGLKRVSKPGQRIYVKNSEIKKVRGGYGLSVVSTPKGLMSGKEAKKQKLGGEVLLEIW